MANISITSFSSIDDINAAADAIDSTDAFIASLNEGIAGIADLDDGYIDHGSSTKAVGAFSGGTFVIKGSHVNNYPLKITSAVITLYGSDLVVSLSGSVSLANDHSDFKGKITQISVRDEHSRITIGTNTNMASLDDLVSITSLKLENIHLDADDKVITDSSLLIKGNFGEDESEAGFHGTINSVTLTLGDQSITVSGISMDYIDFYSYDNFSDFLAATTTEDDVITGAAASELLVGNEGNDNLKGLAGNDTLEGGTGNDTLDGGAGNDTLIGGSGDDTYIVDLIKLGTGAEAIAALQDQVVDEPGIDIDTIKLRGSVTLAHATTLTLEGALSEIENLDASATKTTKLNLTGNNLDNILIGNAAANTLNGGEGNDTLDGGLGNDSLIGGVGNDTYVMNVKTDVIDLATETSGNDTANVAFSAMLTDAIFGGVIENLTLTGTAKLNATGDEIANILTGNTGANIIDGKEGADTMAGGKGNDTYIVDDAGDVVTEALNEGTDTIKTGMTYSLDPVNNVENLVLLEVEDGDFNGTGNALKNVITGNSGNNILDGGLGNDTLIGGNGDDVYIIDTAKDIVKETSAAGGRDTVRIAITGTTADTYVLGKNIEDGILMTGTDIVNLIGNSAANDLSVENPGNTLRNIIDGGAGNDTIHGDSGLNSYLYGGSGNDVITGGSESVLIEGAAGNDILDGGEGDDRMVTYVYSASAVTIDLSLTGEQDTKGAGKDTLSNFNNIWGSQFNDNLTGDTQANFIRGYFGNDKIFGGNGNDTLSGESGNDLLTGGEDDDTLIGGAGNDTLSGGNGSDTASYQGASAVSVSLAITAVQNTVGAGKDTLIGIENLEGSSFSDTLVGDVNNNKLSGGLGNDTLIGGAGDDTLDGGDGQDTASYQGTAAVNVSLAIAIAQNTDGADMDTLIDIENLMGSAFDDTLTGNDVANILSGGAGDDALDGGDGDDFLIGGAGDDALDGGDGIDTASYADATTAVQVSLATDGAQSTGAAGTDTLTNIENLVGSGFADTLTGDDAANILSGGAGNDTLDGGDGDDLLIGGAGNDSLSGGEGDNTLLGGAGNDVLTGGDGIDTASYADASKGVKVTLAKTTTQNTVGAGKDTLIGIENLVGSKFADTLTGDDNDNILNGGLGNDTLNGGDGIDTASYQSASAVSVSLAITAAQNTGGAGKDKLIGIENLEGSSFSDKLTGNGNDNQLSGGLGNDTLIGGAGDDALDGGDGDDFLIGGAGDDALDGGDGIDTASYAEAASGVEVSLATGDAQGAAGTDTLTNIENLVGSGFADTLTGDDAANSLDGGAGNDTLTGADGADTLIGGAGNDVLDGSDGDDFLIGGAGDDALDGGDGIDTASYAEAASGVEVSLATGDAQGAAGTDTLTNIENLVGSGFADTLTGDDAANSLDGGAGNDTLTGADGADTLIGGAGNDVLDGSDGEDTADYQGAAFGVTVSLAIATAQITGGAGTDTLSNIENLIGSGFADTLTGNENDNTLTGGGGNDTLLGGQGADSLTGGASKDILTGGTDADVFIFKAASESGVGTGADEITDFLSGEDKLDFSAMDADPTTPDDDDPFTFIGDGAFDGTAEDKIPGQLRFDLDTHSVFGDIDGNGIADFQVILQAGVTGLDGSDFIL